MTESAKTAPRRRHAQANRRRILDAARETLSTDLETTIDDIARAAGVARRTLYGHFASREELVTALGDDAVESLRQAFVAERNPAEASDLALARYITAVWGIGDRFRMLIALGRRDLDGDIRGALAPCTRTGRRAARAGPAGRSLRRPPARAGPGPRAGVGGGVDAGVGDRRDLGGLRDRRGHGGPAGRRTDPAPGRGGPAAAACPRLRPDASSDRSSILMISSTLHSRDLR